MYFHVRLILHDLGIPLPHEDGFSKVKNAYVNSAYYSICDGYGADATETWIYGDWFYMTGYGIFGHEVKATKWSPPDNLIRWIITQSKRFTRKGIEKISRSVRAYVYLVLTSQVQARSSIVGNSAPAVDAQQVFKSTFKILRLKLIPPSQLNSFVFLNTVYFERIVMHVVENYFSMKIKTLTVKC